MSGADNFSHSPSKLRQALEALYRMFVAKLKTQDQTHQAVTDMGTGRTRNMGEL